MLDYDDDTCRRCGATPGNSHTDYCLGFRDGRASRDLVDGVIVDHDLKIEPQWLSRIISGEKRCEVRFNDRDYQRGDVLCLTDADDRSAVVRVTHVLADAAGVITGWVLSIEVIPDA